MPPKKFRFCDVCRGDDAFNLITCNACGRRCHVECLQRADYNIDKITIDPTQWKCIDCINNVEANSLSTERIQIIKKFHQDILKARGTFFQEQKAFLEPFCSSNKNTFNRLINKYNAINISSNTKSSSPSYQDLIKELINELNQNINPTYIKGELREYQFDGVSKIFTWFSRGIGGILADEMGLGM